MAYIGKTPQIGGYHKLDSITCDGSTAYTMQLNSSNFSPESVNHMIVSVNGVIQAPTTSYTISASTITFASALTSSDTIDFIMCLGNVLDIGTPSDGTVSLSKLSATGTASSSTFLRGDNSWASVGDNTPCFEAYLSSTSGVVSNNVVTKVQFDTEIYDTDSNYDNSTNYRFTPTVAGKYFVYAQILMNQGGGSLNYSRIFIYKNGSAYSSRRMEQTANPADRQGLNISTVIDMNGTTDYLEIFGQAQGGNTNYQAELRNNHFGAFRIIQ